MTFVNPKVFLTFPKIVGLQYKQYNYKALFVKQLVKI